jgi:hypothetical protein
VHHFLRDRLVPFPAVNLDAVLRDKLDRDDALGRIGPKENFIVLDLGHSLALAPDFLVRGSGGLQTPR